MDNVSFILICDCALIMGVLQPLVNPTSNIWSVWTNCKSLLNMKIEFHSHLCFWMGFGIQHQWNKIEILCRRWLRIHPSLWVQFQITYSTYAVLLWLQLYTAACPTNNPQINFIHFIFIHVVRKQLLLLSHIFLWWLVAVGG